MITRDDARWLEITRDLPRPAPLERYRTAHGTEPTLGSILWRYGTRRARPPHALELRRIVALEKRADDDAAEARDSPRFAEIRRECPLNEVPAEGHVPEHAKGNRAVWERGSNVADGDRPSVDNVHCLPRRAAIRRDGASRRLQHH